MTDQSLIDKSLRSVFVGNIPYEATEEKLKDIFSEVGPVLSFKLVYDRDTGKPKGYGFCEYKDQETALSAMRNLNSYEIGGRTLRVDNACTEKSRMEIQNLLQGPVVDNPYGEDVEADKAPEAISKVVTSLPPEQMYELIKQMKQCIINNPTEAKQMLIQNPQLTYALLQVLVAMKMVDPQTALSMLHPTPQIIDPLTKPNTPPPAVVEPPKAVLPPQPVPPPVQQPTFSTMDIDLRMQLPPTPIPPPLEPPTQPPAPQPQQQPPPPIPIPIPIPIPQPQQPPPAPPLLQQQIFRDRIDPRTGIAPLPKPVPAPTMVRPPVAPLAPPSTSQPSPSTSSNPISSPNIASGSASDQEKAALIMQVLQLSDEQIAMLPPEQRQSILVLKEQIAKSTQR